MKIITLLVILVVGTVAGIVIGHGAIEYARASNRDNPALGTAANPVRIEPTSEWPALHINTTPQCVVCCAERDGFQFSSFALGMAAGTGIMALIGIITLIGLRLSTCIRKSNGKV